MTEKLLPGVHRRSTQAAYRVACYTNGRTTTATFSDSKHGGRTGARKAANAFSKRWRAEHGKPLLMRYIMSRPRVGTSGVPGVSKVPTGWSVSVNRTPGVRTRILVPEREGKRAAIALRNRLLLEVYGQHSKLSVKKGAIRVRS